MVLLLAGCVGDGPPVSSRGGLSVRLVVARPPPDEVAPNPCDDDDDDEEHASPPVVFAEIGVHIDEVRVVLRDDDDGEPDHILSVPVDRTLDLVGPASSKDEVVFDVEHADYHSATVEIVTRAAAVPALAARGTACLLDEEDEPTDVELEIAIDEPLTLATGPVRLVIGDGPDPRVRVGLRVDRWLDGLVPPYLDEAWILDGSSTELRDNIESSVVAEVD